MKNHISGSKVLPILRFNMVLRKLESVKEIKPFDCGDFKGMGIGTKIIDAIKLRLSNNSEYAACRFLTVDAYRDAANYYLRNRFQPLLKEYSLDAPTIPMYFDLKKASLSKQGLAL